MNTATDTIRLIGCAPDLLPHFERLNRLWIEKYFTIEPADIATLQHADKEILSKGGKIIFAAAEDEIVGTVALKHIDAESAEMTKLAVDEKFQGYKIGWRLVKEIMRLAEELGYKKVVLYSNTILVPALNMYEKLGFREIPVEPGRYKRSNVKMEYTFGNEHPQYSVAGELKTLMDEWVQLLGNISEMQAAARPKAGKWSIKEILGHLVDSAINNNVRIIRAQQISLLQIPGYDQEFWVKGQAWQFMNWQNLIKLWTIFNEHLVLTIRTIPTEVLQHTVKVNENEQVTLNYLIVDYVIHMKHHLSQINELFNLKKDTI
ncbi:GNAT family N-acetyltransferase [Chitinophaga sancti]|uniref:GNAT family N-acetyltransferase n=1 Tax=Chitinophaga sancti TaxID=1004 RepID=UPI002A75162A|nr:GNAT family N-acetyltransferase [Chitinophaga sancti]WPQ61795.1 GNAT family N-acetyltransferase [Chitinophaga sancti]